MIRIYNHIFIATIAVIGLVMGIAFYYSLNVETSVQGQPSLTASLVKNGYTQNHFIIDKSQFKKAPEFTGITGFVNTPAHIKLADLKEKVVLVHLLSLGRYFWFSLECAFRFEYGMFKDMTD